MGNRGKLLTANQVVTFTERAIERERDETDGGWSAAKAACLGSLPSVFIVILIIYHVNFSTYESVFPRQTVPKGMTVTAETVLAQLTELQEDDRFRHNDTEIPKRSKLNCGLSLESL